MNFILQRLKEIYADPDSHIHDYSKVIIQDVFEPVFSSKEDEEYYEKHADRWQGNLKKIGENKSIVCKICERSEEDINRLRELYQSFNDCIIKPKPQEL